jgi:hypothetical protein
MSRQRALLSERNSLFLHLGTHAQLQCYFSLSQTGTAANDNDVRARGDAPKIGKIVEIRPITRYAISR